MGLFAERGQKLWDAILAADPNLEDELDPRRDLAIMACHAADRVARLEQRCKDEPSMLERPSGETVVNPVFTEARNQEINQARLMAALRLPDMMTGKRAERRQLRGVQKPPMTAVSALDRARGIAG